jgi:hypothetical protein
MDILWNITSMNRSNQRVAAVIFMPTPHTNDPFPYNLHSIHVQVLVKDYWIDLVRFLLRNVKDKASPEIVDSLYFEDLFEKPAFY